MLRNSTKTQTPFTVSDPDQDNLVRITVSSAPLVFDPETQAALDDLRSEYIILWDDGPWMDDEGRLYYEAFPRELVGGT